ncbi:ABC transporter [Candidatus Woesearchaeota archaeon]|nr:ABC transporter [Candidatus Woesearchaeota archaeon]
MLILDQLSKTYHNGSRRIPALQDVKLELKAGESVAVHGPSGCGKSTMLLATGGLLRPDQGRVMLDGQDLYALTPNQRADLRGRSIGMVFQEFHLVPYLDVLENILAPSIVMRHRDEDSLLARALELIEDFGLVERRDHLPEALSTGERQRTALARALVNRPQLLLADEPTGNLDRANTEIVLGHMTEFVADGGAVLLVTHDDRCTAFAQTSLRMSGGQLFEHRGAEQG